MKITETTCYSHLLYLQTRGERFKHAIDKLTIKQGPAFDFEGVAGYIETSIEIEIKDLQIFTDIWLEWYKLPSDKRNQLYSLAKGTCV
jgi:hypothetical protein